MENRVYIELILLKPIGGKLTLTNTYLVDFRDSYGTSKFTIEGDIPGRDIDLLKIICEKVKERPIRAGYEFVEDILQYIKENKKGITFKRFDRETYYSFVALEAVLEKKTQIVVNIPYNAQLHEKWKDKVSKVIGTEPDDVTNMGQSDDLVYTVSVDKAANLIEQITELDFVLGAFDQHSEGE